MILRTTAFLAWMMIWFMLAIVTCETLPVVILGVSVAVGFPLLTLSARCEPPEDIAPSLLHLRGIKPKK